MRPASWSGAAGWRDRLPVEPPLEQPPDERTQLGATWLIEQSTRRLRQRPRGQAEAAVDVLADAAELLGGALHVVHLEAGSKQRSKQGQSNGQSGVKAGSKRDLSNVATGPKQLERVVHSADGELGGRQPVRNFTSQLVR